jgi:hypothetical protein
MQEVERIICHLHVADKLGLAVLVYKCLSFQESRKFISRHWTATEPYQAHINFMHIPFHSETSDIT